MITITASSEKKIALYLLPKCILIEPLYGSGGSWNSSGREIVVDPAVSTETLESNILHQLELSGPINEPFADILAHWKGLIKHAGCKTQKAFFQAAKRVTVFSDGRTFVIEAYSARVSDKTFYRIPAETVELFCVRSEKTSLVLIVQEKWLACFVS